MAERPTTAELETWRVAELPDDFADRVLARLDEAGPSTDDAMPIDADDGREPISPMRTLPRPRPRATASLGIVGIAAAAALLLLWLLRPAPPVPPAPPSSVALAITTPSSPPASGLDPAALRRTLDIQLIGYARLCYEAFVVSSGVVASGQLLLELEIVRRDGRGVVSRAEFDPISELDDPMLRDCILDRARGLVFDPPQGDAPVELEVPFEFQDPWAPAAVATDDHS